MAGKVTHLIDQIGDLLGTSGYAKEKKFWEPIANSCYDGTFDRVLYIENKDLFKTKRMENKDHLKRLQNVLPTLCCAGHDRDRVQFYEEMSEINRSLTVTYCTARELATLQKVSM